MCELTTELRPIKSPVKVLKLVESNGIVAAVVISELMLLAWVLTTELNATKLLVKVLKPEDIPGIAVVVVRR